MFELWLSFFQHLEENIVSFVKDELRKFNRVLDSAYPELLVSEEDEMQKSREGFLNITLDFLQRMKQKELADCLRSSKLGSFSKRTSGPRPMFTVDSCLIFVFRKSLWSLSEQTEVHSEAEVLLCV